MGRAFIALLVSALAAAPAAAGYFEFTGTISFPDSTPEGSARFLPEGVSVSGSGIAYSGVAPIRAIHSFAAVKGFTGPLTTVFGSTAGYVQKVFLSDVGAGSFTTNTVGQPRLHGKMAVRGLAERFVGKRYAAFLLTTAKTAGLGLGGTLPVISGTTPSVRFGTWTTGTVSEPSVVVESHPAMGSVVYGDVTGMGYDARTASGMGTVQFVTPIRTVSQPISCPLPPCEPIPGNRGAVAVLTLTFAPEPGRGAVLLAACGVLALLGRRRAARAVRG